MKSEKSNYPAPAHGPPPSFNDIKGQPPAYNEVEGLETDFASAFANLNLQEPGNKSSPAVPTPDQCIAHLKLLEAFSQLRDDVGNNDGLYGLFDRFAPAAGEKCSEDDRNMVLAKLREKRWAIFVLIATRRFETWFQTLSPEAAPMTIEKMKAPEYEHVHEGRRWDRFERDSLPPLDVLMVWHSFVLNPRRFLADCIRHGKLGLWHVGMPWEAIVASIGNRDFSYDPGETARSSFTAKTGLPWDSLEEPPAVSLWCPGCQQSHSADWTSLTSKEYWTKERAGEGGTGFADPDFTLTGGSYCTTVIDHDLLRVQRFRADIQRLLVENVPMPGTLLNLDGLTPQYTHLSTNSYKTSSFHGSFPNRLLLAGAGASLVRNTEIGGAPTIFKMSEVREQLERFLQDSDLLRKASATGTSARILSSERVALRRMMACYWENSSIFSMDLVGATLRQNSFVLKMHDIDWLHSPAVRSTMQRLIQKYERFIKIIKTYPKDVAVPTLDVDLAWHTHQLGPPSYRAYGVAATGVFIDHDDKIDENKLSTSFEWTSKTYEKMFGEVYSECTCWYCEAIRESHTSKISSLFKSAPSAIKEELARLHAKPPMNPHKAPHISAHNAIKTVNNSDTSTANYVRSQQLERNYQKALTRARKERRALPDRSAYGFYPYWGFYYPMAVYGPFMGVPFSGDMYPSNPACANVGAGAVGNCAAGTCGGGVAAGACAPGSVGGAACAGGMAGGCLGGGAGGGGSAVAGFVGVSGNTGGVPFGAGNCGGFGGGCGGGGGGCGGGGGA